jgi:L-lactate dehydrogenase (cytochrome)
VGGREVARSAIARAKDAGYSTLVVTVDTAISGMRERDVRNGTVALLSGNPIAMLPHIGQVLARPGWLIGFLLDGGLMQFPNVVLPGSGPMKYESVGPALAQSVVTWRDIDWIREMWGGPVVVKGILTGQDARRAADAGASAVVVSNHGGRQLDGVAASLRALPEVVAASGGSLEVLMDGGIRRGSDIVKALCLGAKAVLIGRAYAYGLGAAGRPGVARAIEILRTDVARTLALLGVGSIGELDGSFVEMPREWPRGDGVHSPSARP